jgi:MFS family permease
LAIRLGRLRLDLALALAALANRAYSVALVVYVYNATQSTSWVAAAAAARYLPGIATSAIAHPVLDRFSPRDVLVCADVLCAMAMVAMATAMMLDASPAVPIVLAAVVRVAASGQVPAAARLVPMVAGGRDLSHVAARQAATDKLMLLAGPAIGGVLLLVVRPDVEILALAALVVVAAVISRGLASPGAVRPRPPRLASDQTPAVATARATAGMGIFVAVIALSGFIYGTDTVLLAEFAKVRLQLGDAGYGELFAGLGAGGLLAAPVVNRLAREHRLAGWLALGMAAYGLPSVLIAHSHSAFPVVLLEALRGAGSLTVDVIALTELQRIVLPQGLPLLTARLTAIVFGAVAVGALTTPLLLHALRTTGTFTVLGVIPPAFALVVYPFLRRCDVRTTRRYAELGGRVAVLEHLGLLQATSRPVLERLAADVTELDVPAGITVIVEHDPADAFYVVRSGDLDVFVGERHVNELHAGDWFGEIGLLEELPRTATVRTVTPSVLYRIGGTAFLDAFAQLPPSPSLLDSVAARLATGRPEVGAPVQS